MLAAIVTITALAAWLLVSSRHWLVPALTLMGAAFLAGDAHGAFAHRVHGWPFRMAVDAVGMIAVGVLAAIGFAACAARRARHQEHGAVR